MNVDSWKWSMAIFWGHISTNKMEFEGSSLHLKLSMNVNWMIKINYSTHLKTKINITVICMTLDRADNWFRPRELGKREISCGICCLCCVAVYSNVIFKFFEIDNNANDNAVQYDGVMDDSGVSGSDKMLKWAVYPVFNWV